jgi:hypothetical protein
MRNVIILLVILAISKNSYSQQLQQIAWQLQNPLPEIKHDPGNLWMDLNWWWWHIININYSRSFNAGTAEELSIPYIASGVLLGSGMELLVASSKNRKKKQMHYP